MHGIDGPTWADAQNQLIAAIRTNNPQALIFMEDTGTAFESIVQGSLPDLAWSNLVWNFHLYTASTGTCTEPASARYNNWPQNFDPLVSYAHQNGHGVAITEWGGCNDPEPYHTYLAIAGNVPGALTNASSASYLPTLAPEAIAVVFGTGLAAATVLPPPGPLPVSLGGTTVTVTDADGIVRQAELYYVTPGQVAYQVPPGVAVGAAKVTIAINGNPVGTGMVQIAAVAPGLYTATQDGKGIPSAIVVTVHADGSQNFVYTFQCATATSCTAVPIDLGASTDQVVLELYGTGIRGRSSLANVICKIGSTTVPVQYAGLAPGSVGEDQVNILLPKTFAGAGNVNVALTVDGQAANVVSINFK